MVYNVIRRYVVFGMLLSILGNIGFVGRVGTVPLDLVQMDILNDVAQGITEALVTINFDSTDPRVIKNIGEISSFVYWVSLITRMNFTYKQPGGLVGIHFDSMLLKDTNREIRDCHKIARNNQALSKQDTDYAKKIMLARIACYTAIKIYMRYVGQKNRKRALYSLTVAMMLEYLSKTFRYDVEFGYKDLSSQLISQGFNDKYLYLATLILLGAIYSITR